TERLFALLWLRLEACFFFFQAEDGIRDRNVTGVQTCALPILLLLFVLSSLLNWIPIPWKSYDYIIVLGSGLIGDKVPPLLASRIDKGIELFERYQSSDHPIKIIFTG